MAGGIQQGERQETGQRSNRVRDGAGHTGFGDHSHSLLLL
jgi:hypothetical protein